MKFYSKKRVFFLVAGAVIAGAIFASCTSTSTVLLRGTGPSECSDVLTTDETGRETVDGKGYSCMVATYQLPEAGSQSWQRDDQKRYKLAFLEFDEKSLDLKRPQGNESPQTQALFDLLKSDRQKYVITFIHGWRHDASLQDNDVRRFRVLLAYARSFLNWRCSERQTYCDTDVIGVYIGWRGKAVQEPENQLVGTALAIPTFWSRKQQSEKHAPFVITQIDSIQARLNLKQGEPTSDKMMVIGHSFGGNLLATGLKNRAIHAVSSHEAGKEMTPLLGDLTVLINPASEARNWIDIQKAMRAKLTGSDEKPNVFEKAWQQEYPLNQRPIYVSLTATNDWAANETKGEKVAYDSATGVAFPAGQSAALRLAADRRNAIGHVLPRQEYPFGATHEIITNDGATTNTSYAEAARKSSTQCAVMDGWLSAARERTPSGWDSHYDKLGKLNKLTFVSQTPRVNYQIRHALWPEYPPEKNKYKSYEPANSPFWNMRAFSNVISDHGGYVNYPMWCALNQMVLDNITGKPIMK